mmetsp:Transcript_21039/g.43891  ORF Transcript_21039/g.43891 Transcript_21039/m.43891 type:complete len:291 (+) Transcript_21039:84-956(+)
MSKKRSYNNNGNSSKLTSSRGYPIILASCLRGLERKAAAELKDLCLHHLNDAKEVGDDDEVAASATLSLDEELAMLRKKPAVSSNFGLDSFDTGISGLVCVCFRSSEKTERPSKQVKTTSSTSAVPSSPPPSQPFTIVNTVVGALVESCLSPTSTAPRSRFIQRVVPLMVTCYFDVENIRVASSSLVASIEEILMKEKISKATFGIQFKRRLSNDTPKKEEIISLIAGQFDEKKFAVNLGDPDFTVVVEVLKNFVGIGFVRGYKAKKKLNLLELVAGDDDDDGKAKGGDK